MFSSTEVCPGPIVALSDDLGNMEDLCSKSNVIQTVVGGESGWSMRSRGKPLLKSPDTKGSFDVKEGGPAQKTFTTTKPTQSCPPTLDNNGSLNLDFLADDEFMNYSFENDQ